MSNKRRGEVALQLGAMRYTLCFTLGALAELEDAFGVQDLMALAERFGTGRLSSRDLLTILAIGLRGGGHSLSDGDVANLPLSEGIAPVAAAIAALLVATFGTQDASSNPPQPQGG
ncbi:gene transfer agent family protein [Microvirga flavescens]|uniref:gene transfer agent family protein n=1 Tax=Microvirga flavescens TaxID=2249811 RepID=UPI000DDBE882|nr:gene transfer agent family protein [Microvirga flavescens]